MHRQLGTCFLTAWHGGREPAGFCTHSWARPTLRRPPCRAHPQSRGFRGWRDMVEWRQRMLLIVERAGKKFMFRRLYAAWERWWEVIEDTKLNEQLTTKEQLVVSHHRRWGGGDRERLHACMHVCVRSRLVRFQRHLRWWGGRLWAGPASLADRGFGERAASQVSRGDGTAEVTPHATDNVLLSCSWPLIWRAAAAATPQERDLATVP